MSKGTSGLILLGIVADAGAEWLVIGCRRCERRGRYRVGRLLAEHGRRWPVVSLIDAAAADCPRRGETRITELCGANCPTLGELFGRPDAPSPTAPTTR